MTTTVSAADLAGCFKLTERQVRRLAEDGVVVKAARGKYKLHESVSGFLSHALAGASSAHEPADLIEARRQLLVQQGRREKRQNDLAEGAVFPAADVLYEIQVAMAGVVGLVESLPGRTAGTLAGMAHAGEIRVYLLGEVRHVRQLISDKFAALQKLPLPEMPEFCPLCDNRLKVAK